MAPEPVPSYAAFVLRAGKHEPEFVPLGAAREIESLLAAWRSDIARQAEAMNVSTKTAEDTYRRTGAALRRKIWDPLLPALGDDAREVFVVPDRRTEPPSPHPPDQSVRGSLRPAAGVPGRRSKNSDHEPLARRGQNDGAMDGNVVPRTLLEREGHSGIGTGRELADSASTSGETSEYSSILLGSLHRRWRLALRVLFARELGNK